MRLLFRPLVRFTDLLDRRAEILAIGIGWDGSVLCVARTSKESLRSIRRGASFPKSRTDAPADLTVVRWTPDDVQRTTIRSTTVVSYVQPLPRGFLLVGARCAWRESGAERNGLVCDWEGSVRGSITMGDGIADVRTTRGGLIWASYFDEGVFGNFGWSSPGPTAVGAPGIVRFSEAGEIVYAYDAEAAGTDFICDVYAFDVTPEGEAWACFYTDFPIVRIADEGYETWTYGESAPSALCVHERRALMVGDYDHPARAMLVDLADDGNTHLRATAKLGLADATSLDGARFFGVGAGMYATRAGEVFVLDDAWRE